MSDNENRIDNVTEQDTQTVDNSQYIDAIKQMRATTVSKEDYVKLQEENKKLLQSLVNGETIDPEKVPEQINPSEVVKHILENLEVGNNLQGFSDVLKLVEYDKARGIDSPFLSLNEQIHSDADKARADYVEEVIRDCIEYANGNNAIFTQELQRNLVDNPMVKLRK